MEIYRSVYSDVSNELHFIVCSNIRSTCAETLPDRRKKSFGTHFGIWENVRKILINKSENQQVLGIFLNISFKCHNTNIMELNLIVFTRQNTLYK